MHLKGTSMSIESLGDKIKRFELVTDFSLPRHLPVVLRLDGKAFHTYTEGMERPFDNDFRYIMEYAAYRCCKLIEGCRLGYTQSDEISLLLVDYATPSTEAWFDYRLSKVISVAASICTGAFNQACLIKKPEVFLKRGPAAFDCRAFSIPREDVCDCFLWRQKDSERNCINSIAQSHFSHEELKGISCNELQNMLMVQKGINYNDVPAKYKRGVAFYKSKFFVHKVNALRTLWVKDESMPILTQNRYYVDRWAEPSPIDYTPDIDTISICEDIDFSKVLKIETVGDVEMSSRIVPAQDL